MFTVALFMAWVAAVIMFAVVTLSLMTKGRKDKFSRWYTRVVGARSNALMVGSKGDVNIQGVLLMGIGMVFLAVGFIMFPIVTDATDSLLAYTYSGNITVTDASYTGFTAVVGITPLLILLGFLSAAVFSMYLGVKVSKSGGSTQLNLGTMIMLGLSMVFIAVGLIIMPVALDGISSIVAGDATGPMSTSYTGLSAVLYVTPLLILIAFIGGAVLSGYFGIKKLGGAS